MNQFFQSPLLRRFHLLPLFMLIVAGLVVSWPLWSLGFPLQSDDAKCHIVWYQGFATQFWNGEWYPRWLPDSNAGLGSPAFFYYPPLASYMTCLVNIFDRSADATLADAIMAVGRSAAFALVASGCAMYAWLQTLAPRRFAAAAAVVFIVGPYRIATDIYLRGAFAEHWAFVWLPLILLAAQNLALSHNQMREHRLRASQLRAWCGLAFFYALLWFTHPPTAVIFAPIVVAYSFVLAVKSADSRSSTRSRIVHLLKVGAAMFFSLALAAIYLWPALSLEKWVWMEEMRSGDFFYHRAFITLVTARYGLRLHAFCLALLLLIVAACWAIAHISARQNEADAARYKRVRFWCGVAVFASFMTTTLTAPLYAALPILQRIQFPYRWLGMLSIAVAPLFCDAMTFWSQRAQRNMKPAKWTRALSAIAPAMIVGSLLLGIVLQVIYTSKSYPQWTPKPLIARYLAWYFENRAEMPGHRPRDAQTLTANAPALYREFGVDSPNYEFAKVVYSNQNEKLQNVRLRVVERTPRRVALEIENPQPAPFVIEVRQFAFGSWRAWSAGKNLRISSTIPEGFISLQAPPQTRRITLELGEAPAEKTGKIISLAAFMALVCALIFSRYEKREG